MPLRVVTTMANHRRTATRGTTGTIRPSMLPDEFVAFGVVDQARQIDGRRRGHQQFRSRATRVRDRIVTEAAKEDTFCNSK
jgi:hypothetical protein